jgi:HK97 family phage portal protein
MTALKSVKWARRWNGIKTALRHPVRFLAAALSDLRHPTAWLKDLARVNPTTAGVTVSADTALTLPAYYSAVSLLAQTVAGLPRSVFKHLKPRGREKLPMHPMAQLIKKPCPWMTGMAFWEAQMGQAVGRGNSYAWIERRGGIPRAMWPMDPARMEILLNDRELFYNYHRTLEYDGASDTVTYRQEDIFHVHGLGSTGITGYSPVQIAARTIGVGIAQEEYAAGYFGNDTTIGVVYEHPATMSDTAYERLKKQIEERGSDPARAFRPYITEEGIVAKRLSIPPKDAMMIEQGMFSVIQIARILHVPPHKLAALERATFSNIEHQSMEWVQDGVLPWVKRIEEECNNKLLGAQRGALYTRLAVQGLLRGDFKTRTEGYNKAIMSGWMSPNDARELEDLPPIKGNGGDEYYMQSAMTTLEAIVDPPEPKPAPNPFGAPPPAPEDEEEGKGNAPPPPPRRGADLRPFFLEAAQRVCRKEQMALERAGAKYHGDEPAFIVWANGFYHEQRGYIADAFMTPLAVAGADGIGGYLERWHKEALARALGNFKHDALKGLDLSAVAARMADDVHALTEMTYA